MIELGKILYFSTVYNKSHLQKGDNNRFPYGTVLKCLKKQNSLNTYVVPQNVLCLSIVCFNRSNIDVHVYVNVLLAGLTFTER